MSHDPNAVRSPQRRPVSEFRSVSTVSYSIRNVWGRMFCAGSFQSARQGDSCSTRGSPLGSRMGKRFASRFGGGALGQRAARLVGLPRVGGARGKVRSGRCVRERCFAVRCEANVASGVSKRGSVDAKRVSDFVAGGQETSWPASSFCVGATGTPRVVPPSREGAIWRLLWEVFYFVRESAKSTTARLRRRR